MKTIDKDLQMQNSNCEFLKGENETLRNKLTELKMEISEKDDLIYN